MDGSFYIEELVPAVRQAFGLNLYEAKVWLAVLSRGTSTAGEISEVSGVPRSRVYDILESLERKGFVVIKMEKPLKCEPIHPEEVIERLKERVMEEAKRKIEFLDNLKKSDLMKKLLELHKLGQSYSEPSEVIGYVRGFDNIISYLADMVKEANSEVVIVGPSKDIVMKVEALRDAFKKAAEKGVKVEIYTDEELGALREIGEVIKTDVKGRFVLVDREKVLMFTHPRIIHPECDKGIVLKSKSLAKNLLELVKKGGNQ